MPELPEVETIRRGLATHISGRTIQSVDVLHPRPVRSHPTGVDGFRFELTDRTFGAPARKGKALWLPFLDGDALVVALRMSGQFRVDQANSPLVRHTRVRFHLDDSRELRYIDQRMFGGLTLSAQGADAPSELSHIALDPLDPHFSAERATDAIRRRRRPIKAVLLDQSIMSGIGNIYADESLWRAQLHHSTPAASLTAQQVMSLVGHVTDVLTEAVNVGGTSFDDLYVDVSGTQGYFAHQLAAYGRSGMPCNRCGTTLVMERLSGRSCVRCPECQPVWEPNRTHRGAQQGPPKIGVQ